MVFINSDRSCVTNCQTSDFREKNLDLMRPELICVLKNSRFSIVREVAGADPVAVFRWSILRAFFRAVSAFHAAAQKCANKKGTVLRITEVKVLFTVVFSYYYNDFCSFLSHFSCRI